MKSSASSIDKQASSDTCCWAAEAAEVAVAGTLCFLVVGMRLVASSLALSFERVMWWQQQLVLSSLFGLVSLGCHLLPA